MNSNGNLLSLSSLLSYLLSVEISSVLQGSLQTLHSFTLIFKATLESPIGLNMLLDCGRKTLYNLVTLHSFKTNVKCLLRLDSDI